MKEVTLYNRLSYLCYFASIVYACLYPNVIDKAVYVSKHELTTAKTAKFPNKEIKCLADNIYHEAQGEPIKGKIAVAMVTLNRVKSGQYPKTVCGVVHQKYKSVCQFSWVCGNNHKINKKAYNETKKLAFSIYKNRKRYYDITYGATMFHASYVYPTWAHTYEKTLEIGNHIFYRK